MTTKSYDDHVIELSRHLSDRKSEFIESDSYYNSEVRLQSIGIATPPEMRDLLVYVGWGETYLSEIDKRLDIEGFLMPGAEDADEELWNWWCGNNMDVKAPMAHLDALIHGVTYVTVAAPDKKNPDPLRDPDLPVYHVESALSFYAEVNPLTGRVNRALRMTEIPDDPGNPVATLLLPDQTVVLRKQTGAQSWNPVPDGIINHKLGVPPVVALVNRQRPHDRIGRSQISAALRSIIDAACRLFMNMAATAELMAVPQRLLFGVAQEALIANPQNPGAVLETYMARIIAIESPEAKAFQWAAAELRNFVDGLAELRREAVTITGLPPTYFGQQHDNPASAEAIGANETRLVKLAERLGALFGSSWEDLNRIAYLVMGKKIPKEAFRMETILRNPATPTYAAMMDAAVKGYANGSGFLPKEQARIDVGYSDATRRRMREWDKNSPMQQLAGLYGVKNPAPLDANGQPVTKPAPAKPAAKTPPPAV